MTDSSNVLDVKSLEQAEGVKNLFLEVYGDQYPVDTYYQPQKLLKSQEEDNLRCALVEDDSGACGHLALYPSAPSREVWEIGAGLVAKRARGAAMIAELTLHLLNLAKKQELCQFIFAEAVCNHTITQKHGTKLGFVEMAVELDLMPASAYNKEQSASGRVSSILSFYKIAPEPSSVCLPSFYRDDLLNLYERLPAERDFLQPTRAKRPEISKTQPTRIEMAGLLRLVIEEIGDDFTEHLNQKADVFQLMLPLNLVNIDVAVEEARNAGFFFGGLLPNWTGVDTLLLQRLAKQPDWDGNKIYSPPSQALFQRIREDAESVA